MSKRYASGFTRWLVRQRGENTIIGDLAFDVYNDSDWPLKAKHYHDFYDYLQDIECCDGAMEALEEAWNEYSRVGFGLSRENFFCTCDEFYDDVSSGDFEKFEYLKQGNIFPRAKRGKVYIYVLFEIWKGSAIVKYVGQTIDPLGRLDAHVRNPGPTEKGKWISRLRKGIAGPYMVIIDEIEKKKAKIYEETYIFCFVEYERGLNQDRKEVLFNKQLV